ncbi:cytochrome c oxidase assembly factor Coa1 family protein [Nodosilinea sp. E11]|uniref:cytochrome c oxidase assembly factor Coa1 family protein n=1 Tax=Nodosilinea sp. E11 TaxID=3037479 RepID=UPI0029341C0A|nr:cytochrome c oxidase assembly factor Coa1 family protein [Nodosilinea sp. E11]WOD39475.1 cytochrome c oxidase assembly factor Coa1 family protein [Nodosilinea sp. E11]
MTSPPENPFSASDPLPPPRRTPWVLIGLGLGCGCLLVPLVIIGLGLTGIAFTSWRWFQASGTNQTYELAVDRLANDPQAAEILGDSVTSGWMSKVISRAGTEGTVACLQFPVSGPQGSGQAYAEGTPQGSTWELHYLTVVVDGGDRSFTVVEPAPDKPARLCPDFDQEESDPLEPEMDVEMEPEV